MGNPGTTVYPATLDTFVDPGTATYEDATGYEHDLLHAQTHGAIEAIEATLGTTSGTSVIVDKASVQTITGIKTLTSPLFQGTIDGWISANETWTYASATTITVPAGAASVYQKGDKIKLTQTTVKYFYITTVADTLLTVTGGSDYTVANAAITLNYYSHVENPLGFPDWFAYTPTGPTNTTLTGRFNLKGKTASCKIKGVLTGTPNWTTLTSLPITASANMPGVSAQFFEICGFGGYFDDGIANRANGIGVKVEANASVIVLVDTDSAGNRVAVSTTVPITWATGDQWWANFSYEI